MENSVLQSALPSAPWMQPAQRRLPGAQPLDPSEWLLVDDAFAGQMALRDRLLETRRGEVLAGIDGSEAAATEALEHVLEHLPHGHSRDGDIVTRPDGVRLDIREDAPLVAAGRLVQEDLCLLEKPPGAPEHVLTAAVLCFPASWTLAEKIGRPLSEIHIPVASYNPEIAARVQRMFDLLRPGQILWRQNALLYATPDLYQPRPEAEPRVTPETRPDYLRSERQCILRLPRSGAILFSIHTYVVPFERLTPAQAAALDEHPVEYAGRGL